MDRKRSAFTSSEKAKSGDALPKAASQRARGDCSSGTSSSHTHFYKRDIHEDRFQRVTRAHFGGHSESVSETESFGCVHGPKGRQYSPQGQLKRNLVKKLDPIPTEPAWTSACPPALGWEMAAKLEFLVQDPLGATQCERIETHLRDFGKTSDQGFIIAVLDSLCVILDYLVENMDKHDNYKDCLEILLRNMGQPIRLCVAMDIVTHFDKLRNYMAFLGYLLMRKELEDHFDMVSSAILWHLSAADRVREPGVARLQPTLVAAAPVLRQVTSRMLAVASSSRFPTFLQIALILAFDSTENCIELIKENILENIFYRFNPLFPEKPLPEYDSQPLDVHDINLKLGDSSKHLETTISLLFVLLKTAMSYIKEDPSSWQSFPCPDFTSQRCFCWAYRLECRAHRQHRVSMTAIAATLLHCFGRRLEAFSTHLMPDVMSLSVQSEVPLRKDWTRTVPINTSQQDVEFKKRLLYLSVEFLKTFPSNSFMVESQRWLLGLMYLLDPELGTLRTRWPSTLFVELRMTALQALVCTVPLMPHRLVLEYSLVRRILWYIEWYSVSVYELPLLYWSLRLLLAAVHQTRTAAVKECVQDLFDTHGVIILIHLCDTLLEQKKPPVERSQAVISVALRLVTAGASYDQRVFCLVYPEIRWPGSVVATARKMLDVVMVALQNHQLVSERWLIALLNFVWQTIIWRKEFRDTFVANNGIYKLLDIITMTRAPTQCVALALVCDAARAGCAVGQLVTWRATLEASISQTKLVKRGATIACLLAALFRDDCRASGVELTEEGVITGTENPIMSDELKKQMASPVSAGLDNQRTPLCYAAADLAGSRMPKVFALLQMLSEDLEEKVALADEAYKLYKNVKLSQNDEVILALASHYLVLKLGEAWAEAGRQEGRLLPRDEGTLNEFIQISRGWVVEVKRQQTNIVEKHQKKEKADENSLYSFLARVRLTTALDALREVRCEQRSSNRRHLTHEMLHEAVHAHMRRAAVARDPPVLRTYNVPLDDQNMVGHNVRVVSISRKDQPQPKDSSYNLSPP